MTFANKKFAGFLGSATVVIIAEYLLILSDSVIAGRVLGETALGAMNLLMPVFSTVSFFTWLLAAGTAIVYSDAIGRTDREGAARIAGQGLLTAAVMGCLLVLGTWALENPYLEFMSPDDVTTVFSGDYWHWYPAVVILESLDMVLLYLVYTDGGDRACTLSYVGQVVVNIALSYGLCSGSWGLPKLGMAGISLGTVFAYLVGLLALLPHVFDRSVCGLRFRPSFSFVTLWHTVRASFGDASAGLFHALMFFVITKYVLYYYGSEVLPITAVVFCIVRLTVFFNGVGIALQPLETVYNGEGNRTGIRKLVRFAAGVSFAEGLVISIAIFAVPELLIRLVGISDPDLILAAKRAARISVTGLSGYALAYMLNSHYQYVGRPARSVRLTVLAFFAMPVALLFALGAFIGLDGVWVAVAVGPACAVISFLPLILAKDDDRMKRSLVWSVRLGNRRKILAIADAATEELAPAVGEALAQRAADVMLLALRHLKLANGGNGAIGAEVAFIDEPGCVKLIVRDDGGMHALTEVDPRVEHLPTAGLNRNIFHFDKADFTNSQKGSE